MIKIENLNKYYGQTQVLNDINLEIEDGEIYGLIGQSGAGKSTLLRCINKLEDFQEGSIDVDGIKVENLKENELREFRKGVGMIFQHFSLMQRKTVYENIALPMEVWGYDKKHIDERVKDLAEVVGIYNKLDQKPSQLSGGQQQRVAIARALSLDSKILLSDEATSALDPKTTDSILDLLIDINKNLGITIVVVAHQMEVIKKVCDKVAVLYQGDIALNGKVDEIFLFEEEKLHEILGGGQDVNLPTTGKNIRIVSTEADRKKKIISSIAKDLGISYSVPWSQIEDFKNAMYAVIYINIDEKDLDAVTKYLDEKEMNWRLVDDE